MRLEERSGVCDALKDESVYHASLVSDYVHERRFVSKTVTRPSTESDVLVDPSAPSAIRVFAKSMYTLGIGWFVHVFLLQGVL